MKTGGTQSTTSETQPPYILDRTRDLWLSPLPEAPGSILLSKSIAGKNLFVSGVFFFYVRPCRLSLAGKKAYPCSSDAGKGDLPNISHSILAS